MNKNIPKSDFVDEQFDRYNEKPPENILIILSTQRSGSTYFCEILHNNNLCTAHEYFQPYEYMPILADRWGVPQGDIFNYKEYVRNLARHRTSINGWLGINLHARHIYLYENAAQHLPEANQYFVHIERKDKIAQAISYEIASQTKKWSSNYEGNNLVPNYNFDSIDKHLFRITEGHILIRSFIYDQNVPCAEIYYEDLVRQPNEIISKLGLPHLEQIDTKSNLKRQSSSINAEFYEKFARDKKLFLNNDKFYPKSVI